MINALVLSMAIAVIAMDLAESRAFKWFRDLIAGKTSNSYWCYLVSCPYCQSHWLALLGVWYFQVWLFPSLVVSALAVVVLSSVFVKLLRIIYFD
jgi:hypothetical protein